MSRALQGVCFLLLVAMAPPSWSWPAERSRTIAVDMVPVKPFSPRDSPDLQGRSGVVHQFPAFSITGTPAIRIHLSARADPQVRWRVRIVKYEVGGGGKEYERYDCIGPRCLEVGADFWSGEIPTSHALVRIEADQPVAGSLVVTLQGVSYRTVPGKPEGIVGEDRMEYLGSAGSAIRRLAQPVARIAFMAKGEQHVCTGFLVGPDLLVTNHHCIQTEEELASAIFDFGFDLIGSLTRKKFRGIKIEATDGPHDYSFIRLRGRPGACYGQLSIDFSANPAQKNELLVIHHPRGEVKRVSLKDCSVVEAPVTGNAGTLTDLKHQCDTLPGSSGAPVMTLKEERVVALHHLGCEDSDCAPHKNLLNQGVLFKAIGLDLAVRHHDDLIRELTAQPPESMFPARAGQGNCVPITL